jgi:hypothetical protein
VDVGKDRNSSLDNFVERIINWEGNRRTGKGKDSTKDNKTKEWREDSSKEDEVITEEEEARQTHQQLEDLEAEFKGLQKVATM